MLSRTLLAVFGLSVVLCSAQNAAAQQSSRKIADPNSINYDQLQVPATPKLQTAPATVPALTLPVPKLPSASTVPAKTRAAAAKTGTPPAVANAPASVRQAALAVSVDPASEQEEMLAQSASSASGILPDVNLAYPETINLNVSADVIIRLSAVGVAQTSPARLTVVVPDHLDLVSCTPTPAETIEDRAIFNIPAIDSAHPLEIRAEIIAREKKSVSLETKLELVRQQKIEMDVRQPILELSLNSKADGILGQPQQMEVVVRNTGDGEARELNIDLQLPEGCVADEKVLDQLVHAGSLSPGEETRIQVQARPMTDGSQQFRAVARALGAESETREVGLNVIRPELELAVSAPQSTWVNSRAWYTLTVSNPTTIDIDNVALTMRVPTLNVQTISEAADYDPATQTLKWNVGTVKAGDKAEFQMIAVAADAGPHLLTAGMESRLTERKEIVIDTLAQARANLAVSVAQKELPAPVGVPCTYQVLVENRGTEVAESIDVKIALPEGWSSENTDTYEFIQGAVAFLVPSLAPGERKELTFEATSLVAGENMVRATVRHADSPDETVTQNAMLLFENDTRRVAETADPLIIR